MLVKLTDSISKLDLYLEHTTIQLVSRNKQNPLETVIQTSLLTPQGPAGYIIKESPADVAELVNAAYSGVNLSSQLGVKSNIRS